MQVQINTESFDQFGHFLNGLEARLEDAVYLATKRALEQARTAGVREAAKTYKTTQAQLRAGITILAGSGQMVVRGGPNPLIDFDVKPKIPIKRMVQAVVKKGQGGSIPPAFVQQMGSGHVGVFMRVGQPRYPIRQLYSVSVPQMMGEDEVLEVTEKKAVEAYRTRIAHEIERKLG